MTETGAPPSLQDRIFEMATKLKPNELGSLTTRLLDHAGVVIFQSVSIRDVRQRLDDGDAADGIDQEEYRSNGLEDNEILSVITNVAGSKDVGRWACAMIDQVMDDVEDLFESENEAIE